MDLKLEFSWLYSPIPDDKNAIEENITGTINGQLDDLPVCPGAVLQVSLGSSDHGLSKFGGNVRCQCGRPLLEVCGNSDGSKIEYRLVLDQ